MTTRFRKQLPPNCTIDKGRYVVWRKQVDGKPDRESLGRVSDGIEYIWSQYNKTITVKNHKPTFNTLNWLAELYFDSKAFRELEETSQNGHKRGSLILKHKMSHPETLGHVRLKFVKKPLINQIREKRLKELTDKGQKGTGVINLQTSFLSTILTWGCKNITGLEIDNNPLIGLGALKVEGRTRVVTDDEYLTQYNVATEELQCIFEVAYLTACRRVEIRNLRDSDVLDDRLLMRRRKKSKHNYVRMSDRLRAAITKAQKIRASKKVQGLHDDLWIFPNREGNKMSNSSFGDRMEILKGKMIKLGLGDVYWTLHLLKHKGMTDAEDKDVAGLSEGNKKIYDHSTQTNEPVR